MLDPQRLEMYSQKDHLRLLHRLVAQLETTTDCWTWTGATTSKGYGEIYMDGSNVALHRAVWEVLRGPIPDGLTIDHLCRNRACVNPDHLEPVTPRENTLRGEGVAAKNARKTHCIRGHEFNEGNTILRRSGGRGCRECQRAWARSVHRREPGPQENP